MNRLLTLGAAAFAAGTLLSLLLVQFSATGAVLCAALLGLAICVFIVLRLSAQHRRETNALELESRKLNEKIDLQFREIAELTERLQATFDAADEAILALRAPRELIAANSAAYRLFGVRRNDRQSLMAFLFRAPALQGLIERGFAEGSAELERFSIIHDKGESILTARARLFSETATEGLVIAISDITSLNKMENLKKNFVANVSHELRTPVQIVKGYAEMLSSADIGEEQRALVHVIEHQADRMERIVADLLMLAKLEHDPASWIVNERFNMASILHEAARTVGLRYPTAGSIEITCPVEIELDGSAGLIEQAIFNLMSNAVQHSGTREKILVSASLEDGQVVVRVRDYGAGIAPRDLAHIFERFYRADKARSSAGTEQAQGMSPSGGSGLGLAIVKHIAVAHGGSVRAESWANEGSLFELRIPQFRDNLGAATRREDQPAAPPASP